MAHEARHDRPEVLVVQHVAVEGPGRIREAIEAARLGLRVVRLDLGEPVPRAIGSSAGLVVMGGPMGVHEADRHPHLRDELALLESAIARGTPVLGVCLGSQLLAAALGARVQPSGRQEIGWLDVELTDAGRADAAFAGSSRRFRPLHWHGDVFDLPAGAVSLARSQATEHQAFRVAGTALGLLFHLEVTADDVRRMSQAFAGDLARHGIDRAELEDASENAAAVAPVAARVFERWVRTVALP